jgi:hypothetical protein
MGRVRLENIKTMDPPCLGEALKRGTLINRTKLTTEFAGLLTGNNADLIPWLCRKPVRDSIG